MGKRDSILRLLRKLWKLVVLPITKQLLSLGVPLQSRVWLCPSSFFTPLPIHAAGLYDGTSDSNFPEMYTVSYTPTISELLRARIPNGGAPMANSKKVANTLFIGHKGGGSSTPLASIQKELEAIQSVKGVRASRWWIKLRRPVTSSRSCLTTHECISLATALLYQTDRLIRISS